jgi:long-subunit fatty acid transport protein
VDASITLSPTKQDTLALAAKRFEQPAFSSFSMYEDITYETVWKHKFNDHWAGSAGFKIYAGDWQTPVNRNDWIYTPSAGLTYSYDKHLSTELNYSCDLVQNRVSTSAPGATYADGREYTRHLISLAVKYAF